MKAVQGIKSVAFPNTVTEVSDGAFTDTSLRSAVLNEGLERLGGFVDEDQKYNNGVFSHT